MVSSNGLVSLTVDSKAKFVLLLFLLLYDSPLEEQKKTMNLEQFRYNVDFAERTGLDEFYFWGGEWWYWMKNRQGQPQIWQEAKKLF